MIINISLSFFFVPSAIRVFRKMGDVAMVQSLEGIQVSNTAKATNPSQPLTSSNQDNSANFSDESKVQRSFPAYLFFENTRKSLKSNLVLLVVLVLESKTL